MTYKTLSWCCLISALVSNNFLWAIASALFAIADVLKKKQI